QNISTFKENTPTRHIVTRNKLFKPLYKVVKPATSKPDSRLNFIDINTDSRIS
ncbi:unnamed protein product, partial [Rotaria magnacalcarata]